MMILESLYLSFYLWVLVLGLFVLFILKKSFFIVSEGEILVVERLGKCRGILGAGVHFIVPWIEAPRTVVWTLYEEDKKGFSQKRLYRYQFIPVREQLFDPPPYKVITKDRISVKLNVVVYFKITDPKKAVYGVSDLYACMDELTSTTCFSVCAQKTFDELLTEKDVIAKEVFRVFDQQQGEWGLEIRRVDIQNIECSREIIQATEEYMVARRKADATLTHEKAIHEAAILKAENEKKIHLIRIETDQLRVLKEAESFKKKMAMKSEAEQEYIKAILSTGVSQEYLTRLLELEAWKAICENPNSKLIIPYESAKFLGVGPSLLSQLSSEKEQQSLVRNNE